MINGQAVWITSGTGNAQMNLFLPASRLLPSAMLVVILGSGTKDWAKKKLFGKSDTSLRETMVPGIDVSEVMRCIGNGGGAKHATFNPTGNAFSRIASLVQRGYSAAAVQAHVEMKSGVRIRWNQNDLIRYVNAWVDELGKDILGQTRSECEEARRFAGLTPMRTDYYRFDGDNLITSYTEADVQSAIEADQQGKMINF
jgi:hypothetical protein